RGREGAEAPGQSVGQRDPAQRGDGGGSASHFAPRARRGRRCRAPSYRRSRLFTGDWGCGVAAGEDTLSSIRETAMPSRTRTNISPVLQLLGVKAKATQD